MVLVLLFCPGPARPAPHAAVLVLPFCPGPTKPAPLQLFWFCRFALGRQNLLSYSCFGFAVLPWAGKACSPTAVLVLLLCLGPAKPASLQLFWFYRFALGRQSLLSHSCFGFAVLPWTGKTCQSRFCQPRAKRQNQNNFAYPSHRESSLS